jgi:hypothetical protein
VVSGGALGRLLDQPLSNFFFNILFSLFYNDKIVIKASNETF